MSNNTAFKLEREYVGEGIERGITPICSCGWRGRTEYAYNDYQHTNVDEQEKEHHLFHTRNGTIK